MATEIGQEIDAPVYCCLVCNQLKKDSYLLDCFHTICQDCCKEEINIKCQECDSECLPSKNHPVVTDLFETLLTAQGGRKDKCMVQPCASGEKDLVYCENCKASWCNSHLAFPHNKIFADAQNHIISSTGVNKNEVPFENIYDENDIQACDADTIHNTNNKSSVLIETLKETLKKGQIDQEQIGYYKIFFEEWRETKEKEIYENFEKTVELLQQNRENSLKNLKAFHEEILTNLDLELAKNRNKIQTIERATKLTRYTVDRRTKANVIDQIEDFINSKNTIQKNSTSIPFIIPKFSLQKLENLPEKLTRKSYQTEVNYCCVDIEKTEICFQPTALEASALIYVNEDVKLSIKLWDTIGTHIDSIKGLFFPVQVKINSKTCLGCNKCEPFETQMEDKLYINYIFQHSGDFSVSVTIGNICEQTVSVCVRNRILEKQPVIIKYDLQGGSRGIEFGENSLYEICKKPPCVRKYEAFYNQPNDEPRQEAENAEISLSEENTFGFNMQNPCAIIYFDSHIFVTDNAQHCIFCFTNTGEMRDKIGGKGQGLGEFLYPMGLAVNLDLNLIVIADTENDRLQICYLKEFKADRFVVFGNYRGKKLFEPIDVGVTPNSNYIATTLDGKLMIYNEMLEWIREIEHMIRVPRYIYIDTSNVIYVSSYEDSCIYSLIPKKDGFEGYDKHKLRGIERVEAPTGITMDKRGTLFAIFRKKNENKSILVAW